MRVRHAPIEYRGSRPDPPPEGRAGSLLSRGRLRPQLLTYELPNGRGVEKEQIESLRRFQGVGLECKALLAYMIARNALVVGWPSREKANENTNRRTETRVNVKESWAPQTGRLAWMRT